MTIGIRDQQANGWGKYYRDLKRKDLKTRRTAKRIAR